MPGREDDDHTADRDGRRRSMASSATATTRATTTRTGAARTGTTRTDTTRTDTGQWTPTRTGPGLSGADRSGPPRTGATRTGPTHSGADRSGPTRAGQGAHGRHRRGAESETADEAATTGSRHGRPTPGKGRGKGKRTGSFWREVPLLVVIALVLTTVIQLFLGRIYEIPSGSMETTLHGCTGCTNDRVIADKLTYRFSDPAPGDVVIFKGPGDWQDNDDSIAAKRSSNPVVRTFQDGLSLIGLASPSETDFVKRVIAVGGQTVACCDAQNRVMVDGRPLTEPYLYWQPDRGPPQQESFDPVVVPPGDLWVMGDNRNNSADARDHGPIGVSDVIGRARVVVLPVTRWKTIPSIDPQPPVSAALRAAR